MHWWDVRRQRMRSRDVLHGWRGVCRHWLEPLQLRRLRQCLSERGVPPRAMQRGFLRDCRRRLRERHPQSGERLRGVRRLHERHRVDGAQQHPHGHEPGRFSPARPDARAVSVSSPRVCSRPRRAGVRARRARRTGARTGRASASPSTRVGRARHRSPPTPAKRPPERAAAAPASLPPGTRADTAGSPTRRTGANRTCRSAVDGTCRSGVCLGDPTPNTVQCFPTRTSASGDDAGMANVRPVSPMDRAASSTIAPLASARF
jgi:hypothetical protein